MLCMDSAHTTMTQPAANASMDRKELSTSDRKAIYFQLSALVKDGNLPRGVIKNCAKAMPVNARSVAQAWRDVSAKVEAYQAAMVNDENNNNSNSNNKKQGLPDSLFESGRKRSGRKKKHNRAEIVAQIKLIPLKQRRTFRLLSPALGIPLSTLHRIVKHETCIRRRTTKIKSKLTDANKLERVTYALQQVHQTGTRQTNKFDPQLNVVHVDEKWFYLAGIMWDALLGMLIYL